jgi:hypothetical protein
MKQYLLLIATSLMISMGAMAQGNVTFAAPTGYKMSISMGASNDNMGVGRTNTSDFFRYDHIRPGTYYVTIKIWQNYGFLPVTATQTIIVNDRSEINYFVIIMNNSINIFKANETAIRNNSGFGNNGWGSNGGYAGGWGNNNGGYANGHDHDHDGYGQWPGYRNAMTDAEVASIKAYVDKQSFDDRKLKMLKSVLKDARVYTRQVKLLMSSFSFDDKKLAFAKFAYDNVVDKYNYYQLSNEFSFDSNYEKLEDYIASR